MLKVFIGYDERTAAGYHTLSHSILTLTTMPVAIVPLELGKLARATRGVFSRRGVTAFTFSRFLVPWLAGREGLALFLDSDIIAQADLAQLFSLCQAGADHPAVYVRRDVATFEQSAVMMFNCEHPHCAELTPRYVQEAHADELFNLVWADPAIADLPERWHNISLYEDWDPQAGLVHHTAGVPLFPETHATPGGDSYRSMYNAMCSMRTSWPDLMGGTCHVEKVQELHAKLRGEAEAQA